MALRARDMSALEAKHAPKPKKADKIDRATLYPTVVEELKPSKPRRLTRQERAVVRQMLRDSRKKHGRSRRDYRDLKKRNASRLAEEGAEALVFYLQDEGAGVVSVRQVLFDTAEFGRYGTVL